MKTKLKELQGRQWQAARRRIPLCVVSLFAAIILGGCKSAIETDPVGKYTLATVNGNAVPCALQHEGVTLTVKSGGFDINADGTCVSRMVFTPPSASQDVTREVKATYTREGPTLTMRWEGAGMTTGTVKDNTFAMDNEGMVLVYRK